jgi:hypothetical protein
MYVKYCVQVFLIPIILCVVPTITMDIVQPVHYSDVILKSPDNSKRFYITAGTAQHFGEVISTIQQKKHGSIPEYIVDSPALCYTAMQSLCAHVQQVHKRQYKIDEIDPQELPNVLLLADKLGVAYNAMRIPEDIVYLVHPDAEKPIKIPDVLARNYQKNFNSFVYRDPNLVYPLEAYQMLFDRYEQKPLDQIDQKKLLDLTPSMCNIQGIIMGDDAPRELVRLIDPFIPLLDYIIKNKEETLSKRIQAIGQYALFFNILPEHYKKNIANQADDSNGLQYNLCDTLYEMMYDTTISKDFAQLMAVSAPYIDENNTSEKRQKALKENIGKNMDTIIAQLRAGLTQWAKKDPAASLFWELQKYSTTQKEEIYIDNQKNYQTPHNLLGNHSGGCSLQPTPFFSLLNNIPNRRDFYRINRVCVQNAARTHIPLILAMSRAFINIQNPLSVYYPKEYYVYDFNAHMSQQQGKDTFLRIVPEVDIKALDTLYIDQGIWLNIDNNTIVAPIILCKRPLNISVYGLPEAWTKFILPNPDERGYYSHLILPLDWRRRTLTEWAILLGSVFLLYKCILKPYDIYVRQPYVSRVEAEQQHNFQVQMHQQVLSQCTDMNTAALFFQKAHAKKPFGDASKQLLTDILQKPVDAKTQFSYDSMKHIKQLINTTRSIEKETFVGIPIRLKDLIVSKASAVCGFLIRELYTITSAWEAGFYQDDIPRFCYYKRYGLEICSFLERSIGLIAELFGGDPVWWVKPLHKIHME